MNDIGIIGVVSGTHKKKIDEFLRDKKNKNIFTKLFIVNKSKKDSSKYQNFIKKNENIICNIDVSTVSGSTLKTGNKTIRVSMLEHAILGLNDYDVNLDMGIGYFVGEDIFEDEYDEDIYNDKDILTRSGISEGIRINPQYKSLINLNHKQHAVKRKNFVQHLNKKYPKFATKLLKYENNKLSISDFLSKRKFIPCDLRSKETLLAFIEVYINLYGNKCDFYLPNKLLKDKSIKKAIEKTILKYKNNCEFISPNYKEKFDNKNNKNTIRIFYGYPFDDETYKNLYIFNGMSGAGSGGDDTFCTVFSSGNIPFHEGDGIQNSFMYKCLIPMLDILKLAYLSKFFTLNCYDSIKNFSNGKNKDLPLQIAKLLHEKSPIHKESKIFRDFVLNHLDIYKTFERTLDIIVKNSDKDSKFNTCIEINKMLLDNNKLRIKAIKKIQSRKTSYSNKESLKILKIAKNTKEYPLFSIYKMVQKNKISPETAYKIMSIRTLHTSNEIYKLKVAPFNKKLKNKQSKNKNCNIM